MGKKFVGDGRCDDKNNNCGCGWDDGDCCGYTGDKWQFSYCSDCKCLDTDFVKKHKCNIKKRKSHKGGCGAKLYVGDKRCDDENNNCACNWDNGDCCADSGDKSQFDHCKDCKCLNPTYEPKKCDPKKDKNDKKCKAVKWKGDGNCDDANNNCGCQWDGGDCCQENGDKFQKAYCKVCKCLNPQLQIKCKGYCKKPNWKGDGNCDDDNNNCGC